MPINYIKVTEKYSGDVAEPLVIGSRLAAPIYLDGSTGSGAQGTQGTQGSQGTIGAQGIMGAQGTIGSQGNVGAQGAVGAQGIIGAQGTIGAQGVMGIQGTQGTQGVQGIAASDTVDVVVVSSSRDLAASDHTKVLHCTNAITVTVPTGLATGFQCLIINKSTGDVSIGQSGTTIESADNEKVITKQHTGVSLYHQGSNIYTMVGAVGDLSGAQGTVGSQGTLGAQGIIGAQGVQGVQGTAADVSVGIETETADYNLVSGDNGRIVEMDSGTAKTINIPTGLSTGFQCSIVRYGAGALDINPLTDVSLYSKNNNRKIANQYAGATLYHRGSNVYVLMGDLEA